MSTPTRKTQAPSGQPVHPSVLLQQVLATQEEHRLLLQQHGAVLEHLAEIVQDMDSLLHNLLTILKQQQQEPLLPEMAEDFEGEREDEDDPEVLAEEEHASYVPRRASEMAPLTGEQESYEVPDPPVAVQVPQGASPTTAPLRSGGPAPIEFSIQHKPRRKHGGRQ